MLFTRSFLFIVACVSGITAAKFTYHIISSYTFIVPRTEIEVKGYASASLGLYILCGLCLLGLAITFLKKKE